VAKARAVAAMSVVMLATIRSAGGQDLVDDPPMVFVHVENSSAAPPEIIRGARAELAHIYEEAGVRVESSAEPDHSRCGGQLTVHVVLLDGARAERFIKAERIPGNVLARSNSEARRIYVLWERVGPSVDRQAIPRGDALGLVIAHELGHVLLPGRGHSKSSIMQEDYNVHLSYGLKFTTEESAAMRAFIAAVEVRLKPDTTGR
jgi:hypothetical protein